jgi:hypothetical protein
MSWNQSSLVSADVRDVRVTAFLSKVYGWMFLGLLLTAGTAVLVASSPALIETLVLNRGLFWILFSHSSDWCFYLSARVDKLAPATAAILFLLYSAMVGVTTSVILLVYTGASIVSAFVIAGGMFGANPRFFISASIFGSRPRNARYASAGSIVLPTEKTYLRSRSATALIVRSFAFHKRSKRIRRQARQTRDSCSNPPSNRRSKRCAGTAACDDASRSLSACRVAPASRARNASASIFLIAGEMQLHIDKRRRQDIPRSRSPD